MEVTFTKEETLKLIEEYYSKLEQRTVKATATAKKGYTGWQDEQVCITTITISEKMEIVGMEKEIVETITEEQLNTLLRALFDLYDFSLTSITLNDGLNSRWEGYGYNEHEVKTPYFNGITAGLEKKKNHTRGKRPKGN